MDGRKRKKQYIQWFARGASREASKGKEGFRRNVEESDRERTSWARDGDKRMRRSEGEPSEAK